jgi:uncharacterized membrane protein YcaP (DUF421 family)
MEVITTIFGEGKDLNALQMSCRGIVVFFIALMLIRLSGRRSFGVRTPLDNIITITLGAVLSRAIVGASPFVPDIICCIVIVSLHRFFCWSIVHYNTFASFIEGEKIPLYKSGEFINKDMERALVRKEDIMQGIRKSALTEDMNEIDKVYIERNGEISAVRKKKSS